MTILEGSYMAITVPFCLRYHIVIHSKTPNTLDHIERELITELGKSHLKKTTVKSLLSLPSSRTDNSILAFTVQLGACKFLVTILHTAFFKENIMTLHYLIPTIILNEVTSNAQSSIIYQHHFDFNFN